MSDAPQPAAGGARFAWRRWLGFAIAAGLLAFVAMNLPWRDTLTLKSAERVEPEVYSGTIEGEWKAAEIRFRFDPGQEVPSDSLLAGHPFAAAPALGATLAVGPTQLRGRVTEGQAPTSLEPLVAEWHPGLPRAFAELDPRGLVVAFGAMIVATLGVSTRWWRLLAVAGCGTDWFTSFRLTYVGLFFNQVVPGSTGGDVARAYVVVRDHPERRARALMTVMVDRIVGLVAMAALATVAVFTNDHRFGELRLWVLAAFTAMVGGLFVFLNPTLRRWIRFEQILARLPQGRRLAQLDEALREYAHHPGQVALALALSCCNHLCATGAVYSIGHAFGDGLSYHDYLCITTIANTLTAVPISPGGLGVGEMLFGALFGVAGSSRLLGVATSFVYRLVMATLGLFGGVFLLLPGGAAVRREMREVGDTDDEGSAAH